MWNQSNSCHEQCLATYRAPFPHLSQPGKCFCLFLAGFQRSSRLGLLPCPKVFHGAPLIPCSLPGQEVCRGMCGFVGELCIGGFRAAILRNGSPPFLILFLCKSLVCLIYSRFMLACVFAGVRFYVPPHRIRETQSWKGSKRSSNPTPCLWPPCWRKRSSPLLPFFYYIPYPIW